ncbi:hypothetical protein GH714_026640 [Hevea brasiliensis]|uniref:Chalcone-flavonone isomerase family protein n=1 Tax=Hevea brasiliensis TaxID=3981 RepID=A0A6A6MRB0_HEVBR|nr:hypothetical protein GH714_026640 [Hevea brasiliensis]
MAAVGSAEYTQEPATNVKFRTSLSLPGCSSSLSLLGIGQLLSYHTKIVPERKYLWIEIMKHTNVLGCQLIQREGFAIIGVKVYAAGLYVNQSILNTLNAWKGQSAAEIQENPDLFSSIFQATAEKSLQIILVRDVDGKTFWDALNDAISPRIKAPTSVDESALSTFRDLCLSDGIPSGVDATIESANVTFALFDVFFGDAPVSPSLKASVANGLATTLKLTL